MRIEESLARVFLGYKRENPAALVIFDHDSTLVDTEYAWQQGTREWLARYGCKYDPQIRMLVTGRNQTEVTTIFKEKYDLPGKIEKLRQERLAIIMKLFRKTARPIEPVVKLARFLAKQGLCLAIASGAPAEFLQTTIEMFSWQGLFKFIISGDEVKKGKPSPDLFFYACARAQEYNQVELDDCVVVEDSLNGVLAAKFAGMRCLLVPGVITNHQLEKAKSVMSFATDLILFREDLERVDYDALVQEFRKAAI